MVRVRTRTKFHLGRRGTIVLLFLLGISLLAIGTGLLSRFVKLTNRGVSVEAQVTDIKVTRIAKTTKYIPRISFETLEGETVSIELGINYTSPPSFSKGDKIKIIYLQDDPKTVIMDSFFDNTAFR